MSDLISPQRMVLDTNVLLSLYVFADSRFAPLRAQVEAGRWLALSNAACLDEYRRVLAYPNFSLTESAQTEAFACYAAQAQMVDSSDAAALAASARFELPRCADRDDQKFLELARDGYADCLITADKALLVLARRQKMAGRFRIITPDVALAELLELPRLPG